MRTTFFGTDILKLRIAPNPYLFSALEEALVEAMSLS
jgi:hypothetical protein